MIRCQWKQNSNQHVLSSLLLKSPLAPPDTSPIFHPPSKVSPFIDRCRPSDQVTSSNYMAFIIIKLATSRIGESWDRVINLHCWVFRDLFPWKVAQGDLIHFREKDKFMKYWGDLWVTTNPVSGLPYLSSITLSITGQGASPLPLLGHNWRSGSRWWWWAIGSSITRAGTSQETGNKIYLLLFFTFFQ